MIQALKQDAQLSINLEHPAYQASVNSLAPAVRQSLVSDLIL